MNTTTIYGASDDLIEFEGAIYGEAQAMLSGPSTVILTAPNGETLTLLVGFCIEGMNPDGWAIRIESRGDQSPSWPIRFVPRPGREGDPAVEIDVPGGTVAHCDGEPVS